MRTFPAVAALALGLTLALTGCGSTDEPSSSSTVSATEHNEADVTFASQMIQHHAQALSLVDVSRSRDLDPEVAALVEDIQQAQAAEIQTMSGWLQDWDEEIPATVRDHSHADLGDMDGMDGRGDDTGTDMPGMMSASQMSDLRHAGDADFQDMWLEMMVEHHEGAVQMAETEEANGRFRDAVNLAEDIQESQTAEIDAMRTILGG
jgi:uncharacterized protein (DUF305 family)